MTVIRVATTPPQKMQVHLWKMWFIIIIHISPRLNFERHAIIFKPKPRNWPITGDTDSLDQSNSKQIHVAHAKRGKTRTSSLAGYNDHFWLRNKTRAF